MKIAVLTSKELTCNKDRSMCPHKIIMTQLFHVLQYQVLWTNIFVCLHGESLKHGQHFRYSSDTWSKLDILYFFPHYHCIHTWNLQYEALVLTIVCDWWIMDEAQNKNISFPVHEHHSSKNVSLLFNKHLIVTDERWMISLIFPMEIVDHYWFPNCVWKHKTILWVLGVV